MRVVIPAAGLGTRMSSLSKDSPKTLLPINGRPVLHYIISNILENFDDPKLEIIIGYKGEKIIDFCNKYFPTLHIEFIEQKELLGLAHAISLLPLKDEPLLIWLGDTLLKDNYKDTRKLKELLTSSFILTSEKKDTERWCCVKKENNNLRFIEKQKSNERLEAVIGVYFFKDGDCLINNCKELCSEELLKRSNEYQLSDAIYKYSKKDNVDIFNVFNLSKIHLDIGSIDNFHIAKRALLDKRYFNSLESDHYNSIKKSSENNNLSNQIRWYLECPKRLKKYCPAIYDYDLLYGSYEMEYFASPTLQELFIWDDLHLSVWEDIFSKLKNYVNESSFHVPKEFKILKNFWDFILNKTKNRIKGTELEVKYFEILNKDIWNEKIKDLFIKISSTSYMHGDLCFSNILYDLRGGILKVIDPRGYWENGKETFVGGLGSDLYDLAKLMHSAVYDYDLIKNNISNRNETQNKISDLFTDIILKDFDNKNEVLLVLKAISFNLFLSMIPLHSDNQIHQKMMEQEADKIWKEMLDHLI